MAHNASTLTQAEPPVLLTAADVGRRLGIGRTQTYQLLRSGTLPVLRVGNLIRIRPAALQAWIEAQETRAVTSAATGG